MIVIDAYHQAISQKIAIPPIKDKEICNDGYGCDCERLHVVDCKNAFLQKDSFLREMVKVKEVIYLMKRGYNLIWLKAKNEKNHLLNQLTILYLIKKQQLNFLRNSYELPLIF